MLQDEHTLHRQKVPERVRALDQARESAFGISPLCQDKLSSVLELQTADGNQTNVHLGEEKLHAILYSSGTAMIGCAQGLLGSHMMFMVLNKH